VSLSRDANLVFLANFERMAMRWPLPRPPSIQTYARAQSHQAPRLSDPERVTSPSPDPTSRTEVPVEPEVVDPLTAPLKLTGSNKTGVLFDVKLAGTDQPLPFTIITPLAPGEDRDLGAVALQKVVYYYALKVELPDEYENKSLMVLGTPGRIDRDAIKSKSKDSDYVFHVFTFEPIDELRVRSFQGGGDGVQSFPVEEGMNHVTWKAE
jgi:hypothetical protein